MACRYKYDVPNISSQCSISCHGDLSGKHDPDGQSIFYARNAIVNAARVTGVLPIDTIHIKVHDLEDLEKNFIHCTIPVNLVVKDFPVFHNCIPFFSISSAIRLQKQYSGTRSFKNLKLRALALGFYPNINPFRQFNKTRSSTYNLSYNYCFFLPYEL